MIQNQSENGEYDLNSDDLQRIKNVDISTQLMIPDLPQSWKDYVVKQYNIIVMLLLIVMLLRLHIVKYFVIEDNVKYFVTEDCIL